MKKRLFAMLLFSGIFLLSSISYSLAETAAQPDLKIQLIARDARTHSKISINTRAIEVDALITNNSPNVYGTITVMPVKINPDYSSPIYVTNRPSNAFVDLYTGYIGNAGYTSSEPFSSHLFYLIGTNTKMPLERVKTNQPILLHADLKITLYDKTGMTVLNTIQTQVEDIIYTP